MGRPTKERVDLIGRVEHSGGTMHYPSTQPVCCLRRTSDTTSGAMPPATSLDLGYCRRTLCRRLAGVKAALKCPKSNLDSTQLRGFLRGSRVSGMLRSTPWS
jgi:hypothetical protein